MKINILHLYPDLLNMYGDKGNIESLKKRLLWRGIDVEYNTLTSGNPLNLNDVDILFIGGGSDREEKIASEKLIQYKDDIKTYVENYGVLVAVCGAYPLLGNYFKIEDDTVEGLGILDIYTEYDSRRIINNVVLQSDFVKNPIVGFENHSGRTFVNDHTPLGKVVFGKGNNDSGDYEGVVYKNVVATNLHGPIFPKNPELCDYVLACALKKKYNDFDTLTPLDDTMENTANEYVIKKYCSASLD